MAKKSTVTNMSSAALYKLAQKREQEELAKKQQAEKEKIGALKTKRRELVSKQKKELARIDAEIKKLSGRKARASTRKRESGGVSAAVLEAIAAAGEITTQELKAVLSKKGIVASNLGQTLAYLKRQGKISSPSRAKYTMAS